MNHAADFGFAGEDTLAEERRRALHARHRPEPARRAPDARRGRAIVAAIMALAGGVSGVDPFAPVEYIDDGNVGKRRRRR